MSPRILIVDDDPAIRATLMELLEEEGYAVECAANGAEGLTALERTRPAVVLLDMRMPVLDGWGFSKALRERNIRVPVIMMSAAQEADRWSQEIGATWMLPKPFDLDELLTTVERATQQP